MAREDQRLVPLTAEMLCAFLDVDQAPRLVYLNACDSAPIARELVKRVPMAIGTTAPITNRAARKAAVAFYTRLLEGKSVQSAFETGRMIMKGLDNAATSSELFCQSGCNAQSQRLHAVTRILARFLNDVPRAKDGVNYKVELGLVGCPRHTKQIIFFTDDESFGEDSYSVVRGTVVRGEMWLEDDPWETFGDFRLFACGITAGGDHYSVTGELCTAIKTYYDKSYFSGATKPEFRDRLVAAIAQLRSMDGTSNRPRTDPRKPSPKTGNRKGARRAARRPK
jgi:hypothetical protein